MHWWLSSHSWAGWRVAPRGYFDLLGARSAPALGYMLTDPWDWLCAGCTQSQLAQGGSQEGEGVKMVVDS